MSRGVSVNVWEPMEMAGNKREQTATQRDTKSVTLASQVFDLF
jgi:hypothetical protein